MGVRANFTNAEVRAAIYRRVMAIDNAIINRLKYLGEQCVIEMRTAKTFLDQTSNLISSTGYVIVKDGRILGQSAFDGKGPEGGAKGWDFAKTLVTKHPTGYALYVVAGMNYAAYVEARGYNVIGSAELFAEREMPKMLKQLEKGIGKML